MIIAIGSTNPTKIDPVKKVFSHYFGEVTVTSVSVESGVSDQPTSDDETYRGALNRAKKAIADVPDADYGVGIEGGVHKYDYGWFERSFVVVVNREGTVGIGSSGGLVLPQSVSKLLEEGKNLEEAVDQVTGTTKIGSGIGMFGYMTKSFVTRSTGMEHGIAFALARFLHEKLYDRD